MEQCIFWGLMKPSSWILFDTGCFLLGDTLYTPCTPHNVNYYTREMMNEGDSLPIGIILCADKSDSAVKYTLPEDNNQIFTSKRRSKSTSSRWRDNKPCLTFYTQTFEIKKHSAKAPPSISVIFFVSSRHVETVTCLQIKDIWVPLVELVSELWSKLCYNLIGPAKDARTCLSGLG